MTSNNSCYFAIHSALVHCDPVIEYKYRDGEKRRYRESRGGREERIWRGYMLCNYAMLITITQSCRRSCVSAKQIIARVFLSQDS